MRYCHARVTDCHRLLFKDHIVTHAHILHVIICPYHTLYAPFSTSCDTVPGIRVYLNTAIFKRQKPDNLLMMTVCVAAAVYMYVRTQEVAFVACFLISSLRVNSYL